MVHAITSTGRVSTGLMSALPCRGRAGTVPTATCGTPIIARSPSLSRVSCAGSVPARMDIFLEVLKFLPAPILFGVWKRLVRIRVTTHLGCLYERRRTGLEEAMEAGADPGTLVVEPGQASAIGPADVPPDTPYRDALFVRVINRSERDITVMRIWVETESGPITVGIPDGQQLVPKDRLWETWAPLDQVRQRIANPEDYYTSVRVRVLQSRWRTWRSVKADDIEVGMSGDVAVSARRP